MRTVLLDASPPGDDACRQGLDALRRALSDEGAEVRAFPLADLPVAPCKGCFACWTVSPGRCPFDDASAQVARAVPGADLLAVYAPAPFGVWGWQAKKVLDRMICLISPHFAFTGLTRHRARYAAMPALLGVGWMHGVDAAARALFPKLVEHNAYNMRCRAWESLSLEASGHWGGFREACRAKLRELLQRGKPPAPMAETLGAEPSTPPTAPAPARSVLLLEGSPRKRGVSSAVGSLLAARIADKGKGVQTDTLKLAGLLESQEGRARLLAAFAAADTVILASPVYADCPPAPVLRAMEFLAGEPWAGPEKRLAAVACCGFPEASHTAITLEACAAFARRAGLRWLGGLGVGGAGALEGAIKDGAVSGVAARLSGALDQAAEALGRGQPLPAAVVELIARPLVPKFLYLLLAEMGWFAEAVRHGHPFGLGGKPYAKQ